MKKIILLVSLVALPLATKATEPSVQFNEIAWMGTEFSASDEWLELFNNTNEDVDLSDWKIEASDGTPLISLTGIILANDYFLLERTDDETVVGIPADQIYSGALSNTGENLKLINPQGVIIDQIDASLAGWPAGDNETKQTMERTDQGWQTSLNPEGTPKANNSTNNAPPTDEEPNEDEPPLPPNTLPTVNKGEIVINEILPDTLGTDLEGEFIELKNVSNSTIDLTSWQIILTDGQTFTLPSLTMLPKTIVVYYRPESKIALNNLKDTVTLKTNQDKIIDRISYRPPVVPGKSLARDDDGSYHITKPSPKEENVITKKVLPVPRIEGPIEAMVNEIINFDGSDSFDPLHRDLGYFWDFGDKRKATGVLVRQLYTTPGKYEVALTVLAGTATNTKRFNITILDQNKGSTNEPDVKPTSTPELNGLNDLPFIFISEFLPNPSGSDLEGEFIEIFNNDTSLVNLNGWNFDDGDGGSKPYEIKNAVIKPGQYLAFFRPQTKIALNNDEDQVRLITPTGIVADLASYEDVTEGESFVLDEKFIWQKTVTPTPGEINALNLPETKNEPATTTPLILGVKTPDLITPEKINHANKYLAAGISAAAVLGLGVILKIKK